MNISAKPTILFTLAFLFFFLFLLGEPSLKKKSGLAGAFLLLLPYFESPIPSSLVGVVASTPYGVSWSRGTLGVGVSGTLSKDSFDTFITLSLNALRSACSYCYGRPEFIARSCEVSSSLIKFTRDWLVYRLTTCSIEVCCVALFIVFSESIRCRGVLPNDVTYFNY